MKLPAKALVTDLDGVIRYFPAERDRQIEKTFDLPAGTIASTAFEPVLLQSVITGQINDKFWRETVLQRLKASFPEADAEAAMNEWSGYHGEINYEVLSYLEEMAAGLPLVLLTNATSRLVRDLSAAGIHGRFSRIFNSSEIGLAKPSTDLFLYVGQELGLSREEIIFVDDSLANVRAADALGFQAFHFSDLEALKRTLASPSEDL